MGEVERIKNILIVWADFQEYPNLVKLLNGEESIEEYLTIVEKNAETQIAKTEGKIEQRLEDNKENSESRSTHFLEDMIKTSKENLAKVKQWREKLASQKQ